MISFSTVFVVKEGDTGRTVRIVLDALHYCGNTVFCSLKVNDAVFALVATTKVAGGEMAFGVTSSGGPL